MNSNSMGWGGADEHDDGPEPNAVDAKYSTEKNRSSLR